MTSLHLCSPVDARALDELFVDLHAMIRGGSVVLAFLPSQLCVSIDVRSAISTVTAHSRPDGSMPAWD